MRLLRSDARHRESPTLAASFSALLVRAAGYAFLSKDGELLAACERLRDTGLPLFREWKTAKAFELREPDMATPEIVAAIKGFQTVLTARIKGGLTL